MTPKPSQTDLSIKSYDKNSAKNGLPSAAAKLTPPLRDDVPKCRTRGGHSNENSNQFLKPWYTLGFRGR